MLKFVSVVFSICCFIVSVYGQEDDIDALGLDSVQIYSPDKTVYTFFIDGGTQGIFMEALDLSLSPRMEIRILNNTSDTIINTYRPELNGEQWKLLGNMTYKGTIPPNSSIVLSSKWIERIGKYCPVARRGAIRYSYIRNGSPETKCFWISGVVPENQASISNKHDSSTPKESHYFENGYIKKEVYPVNIYHYSEEVEGQLVQWVFGDSEHSAPVVYDYKEGELVAKTSPKLINRKTVKISYNISKGKFIGEDLFEGTIEFYSTNDELVISKIVENGIQQEGVLHEGERYNLKDSIGRKTGKWITLLKNGEICSHYSLADYGCRYIGHKESYLEGMNIDTTFSYFKSGNVRAIQIHSNDPVKGKLVRFSENGSVRQTTEYISSDSSVGVVSEVVTWFSDTIPGCIIKRTLGKRNQGEVDYTYDYRNCELFSKTSARTEMFFDTTQTLFPEYIDDEIFYVKRPAGPGSRGIPYTVEIGKFDAMGINLINGVKSYYDEKRKFQISKEVVDGVIVDSD